MQSTHSVPLGAAAQEGHTQVIEKLLKGGANINHQDKVRSSICSKTSHNKFLYMYYLLLYSLVKQPSSLLRGMVMCK